MIKIPAICSRIKVLRGELASVRNNYDYILMDTNPSLTLLTINSLFAADYVLIPAFAEAASRDAIRELWDTNLPGAPSPL